MKFCERFWLRACIVGLAFAASPWGNVARAFDRPAVAERSVPRPPSEFTRRYGNGAFRQSATKLAFSPDGRWLAAGDSQIVTLFDAKTGDAVVKTPFPLGMLAGLAFSPDGQSLVVVQPSGLLICDAKEGAVPQRVPAKLSVKVGYLKFSATSPDGKWRATMPNNEEVGIGPWDQVEPLHKIPFKSGYPDMAMGNDGQWLATTDPKSSVVQIWKAPKFDSPEEWKIGNVSVRDMVAAPDGETFYISTFDGAIRAWNVKQGREVVNIPPVRRAAIHTLALSQKGTYLAAATESDVTILETKTGRPVQTVKLSRPTNFLISLAFSPDENILAIGPHERPLELWNVKTGEAVHRPTFPRIERVFATKDPRRFVSHNAKNPEIYASTDEFAITYWNRETGLPEESFPLNPWVKQEPFQQVDVLFHGAEQLLVKQGSWELFYRNLALGQKDSQSLGRMPYGAALTELHGQGMHVLYLGPGIFRLKGLPFPTEKRPKQFQWDLKVPAVPNLQWTFSPDGQILAGSFADRSVFVWETKTGNQLHKFQFEQSPRRILLNPNGQVLAVAFEESITLWDLKTGKPSHEFQVPKSQSHLLAFGTQAKILAVAAPEERFRLFSLESGKEILTLPAPDFPAEVLAFSPDDKWLAAGYQDKSIGLFDLDKKQEVHVLEGHTAPITALSFDPEGSMLLSGSKSPEAFVWDTASGKRLSSKKMLRYGISQVSWSAEGDEVFVVEGSGLFERYSALEDNVKSMSGGGSIALDLEDFDYCPETETLAVGSHLGIRILENIGRELPFIREDNVRHVAWTAGGRILMAASADLFGFDVEQEKEIYRIPAARLTGPITAMEESSDGQIVATGHSSQGVNLWDPRTGRLIRTMGLPGESSVESLNFSPDGRLLFAFSKLSYVVFEVESGLVWFHKPNDRHEPDIDLCVMGPGTLLSAESQGAARLWSWTPDLKASEGTPSEELWDALASNDGPTVCQSMFALAHRGDEAVEFLTRQLPLAPASPEKVAALIKDLDHEAPAQRRKASEELRALGAQARPHLEEALKNEDLSPRLRSRIQFLLNAQPAGASPELLSIRAVQLLEWIATPKAYSLLEEWAKKPDEPLSREAQAALRRLPKSER